MWMIQLQRFDQNYQNAGGLYINVDHIVAVIPRRFDDHFNCSILTTCGVEYDIVNELTEVLDEIVKINVQRIKGK